MTDDSKAAELKTSENSANIAKQRLEVNDSAAVSSYANFCRVIGTPEEVVLDFGINAQALGQSPEPIKLNQRLIVNYYTAKRMLAALQLTVQRHEAAFGTLEIDVQKRLRSGDKPSRGNE